MISGRVTADWEAVIRLEVLGRDRRQEQIEAVLDTGFNGSLTLPSRTARSLDLPFLSTRRVTLAGGTRVVLGLDLATVVWHEGEREVPVPQAEGEVLIGMALLEGSRVTMDVVQDGGVGINPLG